MKKSPAGRRDFFVFWSKMEFFFLPVIISRFVGKIIEKHILMFEIFPKP